MPTKPRLLLIDDSPDNLEFLHILLSQRYWVFSYASCREAWRPLIRVRPDLLVLDVRMFPMNGMEFLKKARRVDGFRDVPAIAVTALAHDAELRQFLAAGFQRVVTKPIMDPMRLYALIDEVLNGSEVAAERGRDLDPLKRRSA